MKTSATLTAILLFAATGLSLAQETGDSGHAGISAQEFIEKAGAGGLAEVDMGELGSKKATSRQVKSFAKQVVADHTKANNELMAASKGKGQVPSARDPEHKAMMDKFQQMEAGKEFDRDYMAQMVADHKADIELFETAADDAKLDTELRAYAKKTLPTLRDHLSQAQAIESKLN